MQLISLLSGILAALGAAIFFYSSSLIKWGGLGVLMLSMGALCLSVSVQRRQEKEVTRLHRQIMDFLTSQDKIPNFSVNDDLFAVLENSVVELENKLLLEHDNTRKTSKRNADFITDVSHQLKTPLTALKLYCEMDQTQNFGTHSQKQLVLIERMEHLIYSLLRLEKLRADVYELQFAKHDLSQLLEQVWDELRLLYPKKKINIVGTATLRCDAYWLNEAMMNVLKNACEHTATDGQIQVLLETTEAAVTVSIEDNGGGIAAAELPKLFQRFYRTAQTKASGGAGIGLAITKTIVEKHHGTIYAENMGPGLRMTMCFPILDGVLAAG
ncbi:MAG TPA: HAMP domain-containing sensor histidine kinase [Oscillospiraceae bacterium]|nr:HAMP domain-containing sensor histidine kinase [Oscillospiraceae bacterium]